MSDHYIFGYGSLVNRATHDYDRVHPASLRGWRREWRFTTLREVAFLNVVQDANCEIQGLIMGVARDAPDLDKREYAYRRTHVSQTVSHGLEHPAEINLFAIPTQNRRPDSEHKVILLSYIDVVVQGYFREFGEAGVAGFFATTSGWETCVINDRSDPRYPRHQPQHRDHTDLTDYWLAKSPAVVKQLEQAPLSPKAWDGL